MVTALNVALFTRAKESVSRYDSWCNSLCVAIYKEKVIKIFKKINISILFRFGLLHNHPWSSLRQRPRHHLSAQTSKTSSSHQLLRSQLSGR